MLSILKSALRSDCNSLVTTAKSPLPFFGTYTNIVRFKKNHPAKDSETEAEAKSDQFEDAISDKSTKIMNVSVKSLRTDLLLKAGLGIARNKIETLFYDSKIRVNGQKVIKKGAQVHVGDEIDVIKGPSPNNPNFLTVARVEILSADENEAKEDGFRVKLRRSKALTVENYVDQFKPV